MEQNLKGARILIAEDEPLAALELRERLESMGCEVIATVSSGETAVANAMGTRPDLIIMDIHLRSFIDGIDAAERLRFAVSAPIIYVTAYHDEAMRQRAMKTGPVAYLLKPLEDGDLRAALTKALTQGNENPAPLLGKPGPSV